MRGLEFTAASRSLIEVLRIAIYLPRNARVQTAALALGGDIRWLRDGEIAAREAKSYGAGSVATQRAWHYWANRCGKFGRAHVRTPVPTANPLYRPLLQTTIQRDHDH